MRLTYKDKNGVHLNGMPPIYVPADANRIMTDAVDKLAAYEDAEEQGRLVILPCKVGDTVFYTTGSGVIYKAKAVTFRFNESGTRVYCERKFMGVIGFEGIFGKTVFLSREEAEAALNNKIEKES